MRYTVVRGDSLWKISGKPEIYNNPYEWPLIYKNNADKIRDADLIYPGQEFSIIRNPSQEEVEAAIRHAKTRGAWSLGVVEESDREYLGGNLRLR
ncbi:MAG TPA: LysM peptidoglycan-binding domain-containing protein [Thiotrichales bacterium]|nr:LysM peptidoglycan-binding domain-containing protein [Thiotrichales bacterium]